MRFHFDLFGRGLAWKANVEQGLEEARKDLLQVRAELEKDRLANAAQLEQARQGLLQVRAELDRIGKLEKDRLAVNEAEANIFHCEVIRPLTSRLGYVAAFADFCEVLISRRNSELLVLLLHPKDLMRTRFDGADVANVLSAVWDLTLDKAFLIVEGKAGNVVAHRADELLPAIRQRPTEAFAWAKTRKVRPTGNAESASENYFAWLERTGSDLDRLDFHARGAGARNADGISPYPPFDEPDSLPSFVPAEARRRSALFLHNNYYHFNCLSAGLRKRGWDTITVSCESPDSPQQQFYHGEDVNLYDADPAIMRRKIAGFFKTVPERYSALHFCGMGYASFFPENIENNSDPRLIPWDFLELRRHRVVIGYMPSGCMDGGMQSSIRDLTAGLCGRCVWELRPDVCSDARNLAWNRKLAGLCDWVGLECDHATPERVGEKTVYGPVVTTLDPGRWHPNIEAPPEMDIGRSLGEVIVYHGVGNYHTRRTGDRDIKGTGSLIDAIETLKAEGLPVRLVFAHDIPSTKVRFLQVQADIVVDQLNYGRYGANAREALMLGKPTICRLSALQSRPLQPLRPIQEVPMIDANEEAIADVLRALVLDPERRLNLGRRARAFALAWHGQDACAERYERVIDRIHSNLPPESPDIYPSGESAGAWLT